MLEKLQCCVDNLNVRPVFVIGTGRSGTHWLGYSLGDHPEVQATIEVHPMFMLSTRMALNPSLEDELFGKLVRVYCRQIFRSAPKLYLDKSHPNIWIAEKLLRAFPRALFVAIERNPYATVSSMMKHEAVSAWHKRWREFPIPNRFLGITEEIAKTYDSIPFPSQCAIRWVAHRDRIRQLRGILGDQLLVISYETFAHETRRIIQELQEFLGLAAPIPIPNVRTESLDKWKAHLTDQQVHEIRDVVGFGPDTEV